MEARGKSSEEIKRHKPMHICLKIYVYDIHYVFLAKAAERSKGPLVIPLLEREGAFNLYILANFLPPEKVPTH